MILRRIQLACWRALVDQIELGPFDEGLNLVFARNGSGKSTLFEAMRCALLDGHKVTGAGVNELRPWGRQVSPRVSVEFRRDGAEYRVRKQFLDEPMARLEKWQGERFEVLAESVNADQMARELFTRNPPGRGTAKAQNWGSAQALWAAQGKLDLDALSDDAAADVRAMLNAQLSSPAGSALENKVKAAFGEYFTPKDGKLKTGKSAPRLVRLREQLAEAREQTSRAQAAYEAYGLDSAAVEALRTRRDALRSEVEEARRGVAATRDGAKQFAELRGQRDLCKAAVEGAMARYGGLQQSILEIESAQRELNDCETALKQLGEELPGVKAAAGEMEARAAKAQADLAETQRGRTAIDAALSAADAAREFVEAQSRLKTARETLAKVEVLHARLTETRTQLDSIKAPSDAQLKAMRATVNERNEADALLKASLITLEILPHTGIPIEVVAGEEPGAKRLREGEAISVAGSPEVIVEIPGVARLRASGGAASAGEHRTRRDEAERKIRAMVEPFGTSDLDVLHAMRENARAWEIEIRETEAELKPSLGGSTPEALRQNCEGLESAAKRLSASHPDWLHAAPQWAEMKEAADTARRAYDAGVTAANDAFHQAQRDHATAKAALEKLLSGSEAQTSRGQALAVKLARWSDAEKNLTERRDVLQGVAMECDAAKGKLNEAEARLSAFAENPEARLASMESRLHGADESFHAVEKEIAGKEATLRAAADLGAYSVMSEALETEVGLQEDVKREELRLGAIRLLQITVEECRREALSDVARPVQEAASALLDRIAGRRVGAVRVGEGFAPMGVRVEGIEEAVDARNLSGGEREQLYLATRLALAKTLKGQNGERLLLVLDDVLTATDAERLARVAELLQEMALEFQILLLTCHPEKFERVAAKRFDLEAILAGARAQ